MGNTWARESMICTIAENSHVSGAGFFLFSLNFHGKCTLSLFVRRSFSCRWTVVGRVLKFWYSVPRLVSNRCFWGRFSSQLLVPIEYVQKGNLVLIRKVWWTWFIITLRDLFTVRFKEFVKSMVDNLRKTHPHGWLCCSLANTGATIISNWCQSFM